MQFNLSILSFLRSKSHFLYDASKWACQSLPNELSKSFSDSVCCWAPDPAEEHFSSWKNLPQRIYFQKCWTSSIKVKIKRRQKLVFFCFHRHVFFTFSIGLTENYSSILLKLLHFLLSMSGKAMFKYFPLSWLFSVFKLTNSSHLQAPFSKILHNRYTT